MQILNFTTFCGFENFISRLVQILKNAFLLDRVFSPDCTQEQIFEEVEDLLESALDGNNVCLMAFGQTGSGKSHRTMQGTAQNPGIIPQSGSQSV
jgi:hypothetical protein